MPVGECGAWHVGNLTLCHYQRLQLTPPLLWLRVLRPANYAIITHTHTRTHMQ